MIARRIERAGPRLKADRDLDIVNPEDDPRFRQLWDAHDGQKGRDGITPEAAKAAVRRSRTLIAALPVRLGYADDRLCGLVGRYEQHFVALNALMLHVRTLFIADTFVSDDPDAQTPVETGLMSAEAVTQFGLEPRVAFLSHSKLARARAGRRARCTPRAASSPSACPTCRPTARCKATPR